MSQAEAPSPTGGLNPAPTIAQLRARAAGLSVQIATVNDTIETTRNRIKWAQEAAAVRSCPNCDCQLIMRDGELVPAAADDADLALSPEQVEQLNASLAADVGRHAQLQEELQQAREAITAALSTKANTPPATMLGQPAGS